MDKRFVKKCVKCGEIKPLYDFPLRKGAPDGYRGQCKVCNREYNRIRLPAWKKKHRKYHLEWMRQWRYRNYTRSRVYSKRTRDKDKVKTRLQTSARMKVYHAIKRGLLKRQSCAVCGKKNACAHHPDYTKPFAVVWLCVRHHNELHGSSRRIL